MTDPINNTVCIHAKVTSEATATLSIGVNPMFAPDDVVIPVIMTTATHELEKPCNHCGRPYYDPTR